MPTYPYKSQVQIVVASMALHNYIMRKSQEDFAFTEYDRNPNFILDDILADVFPCSQSQGNQRSSRMNYVRDVIADSLMR
jgi:hypothetical protein